MARRDDDDDDDRDDDRDDDDDLDVRRKRKRRGRSEAIERLAGPAIGLISVVSLHLVLLCIALPFNILALVGRGVAAAQGNNIFLGGNPAISLGQTLLGYLVQGFLLYGAIQMKRGEMYGVCMATAILSCIPCFCSSCAILGIPFGIWALVILMDEKVKASFPS